MNTCWEPNQPDGRQQGLISFCFATGELFELLGSCDVINSQQLEDMTLYHLKTFSHRSRKFALTWSAFRATEWTKGKWSRLPFTARRALCVCSEHRAPGSLPPETRVSGAAEQSAHRWPLGKCPRYGQDDKTSLCYPFSGCRPIYFY